MFANSTLLNQLLQNHSAELVILALFSLVVITLIVIVPQLLRSHSQKMENVHKEHMRSLEQGLPLPIVDESTKAAGRTAMLVPMVSVISAGTVTCFMIAYKTDNVFAVALSIWTVAAVVSLAAITGGVALIGRVEQLKAGAHEDVPDNPLED